MSIAGLQLTYNGQTKTKNEWARVLGITRQGLERRLRTMPLEKALTMKNTKSKMAECCYPDCFNCSLPDCQVEDPV